MTPKHLCVLLIAVLAVGSTLGQSDDIPVENDNQFPPDDQSLTKGGVIEGSGDGTIEEPPEIVTTTTAPTLEDVQYKIQDEETTTQVQEDQNCPNSCSCHFEGGTENFVVDCANAGLLEFPSPLDPKTTTLNIQNNRILEIPKEITILKQLKVLNADHNAIMDVAFGSVSELAELTVLKLSNNRLIEYPKDLKNSIVLTKLEELDLAGNDMRTGINAETFSNLPSLRKLTLPSEQSGPELLEAICSSLKGNLETVCTASCEAESYDCQGVLGNIEDEFIDAVLPGAMDSPNDNTSEAGVDDNTEVPPAVTDTTQSNIEITDTSDKSSSEGKIENSGRSRSNPGDYPPVMLNNIIEKAPENETSEKDVKVGAATTAASGGVDKSVIGIIVAAMVVVVAGITLKKNWSSIRKRFSSEPRASDRATANGNGTAPAPEEVPLQEKDKSPV